MRARSRPPRDRPAGLLQHGEPLLRGEQRRLARTKWAGSEPYGYILKPFEPKQVHAVLQLALSRRAKEIAANGGLTPDRTWAKP